MADNRVDELIQHITRGLRENIPKFYKEWRIVGFSDDTQKKFADAIYDHHEGLWLEMMAETMQRKSNLLKNIDIWTQELKELGVELNTEVDLDYGDVSLLVIEKHLQAQLEELKEIKEARLAHFKDLFEKETEIGNILGSKAVGLDSTIPTEEQLQRYEAYITEQEADVIRLKAVFKERRMEIMKTMDELGLSPKLEFQRFVVNDHHNFVFTSSNMKKLEELRDELMEKLASAKETAELKRQELLSLLEYLDVPRSDYEDFLQKTSGCDATTIALLTKEIKKCKEIRMKNMEKYIEKMREEIAHMWDLCKFGNKQRDAFKPYQYQTYNEDVLTLHELELEELKKFYEQNEQIFEYFGQHQEMVQKMEDLELKSEDPNRLNNRGGQLLEEEKTRKVITKNLPKTEAKLKELLRDFQEANDRRPFTFHGYTFEEFIQRQAERFNEEKENLRLARAKAKDEKKSAKKTPLSASRRNVTTATSLRGVHTVGSVKRRLPMEKSPMMVGGKKRAVQSEKARPTLVCGTKIRRSGIKGKRLLSNSLTKDSPRKKTPKILLTKPSEDTLNLQQYEEFQEHLSSRNELRSTLLSDNLLKSIRDGKRMKTPVKTPVKPLRKHVGGPSTSHVTPKTAPRRPSRSPRITSTPRLTTAPANGLSHLKL